MPGTEPRRKSFGTAKYTPFFKRAADMLRAQPGRRLVFGWIRIFPQTEDILDLGIHADVPVAVMDEYASIVEGILGSGSLIQRFWDINIAFFVDLEKFEPDSLLAALEMISFPSEQGDSAEEDLSEKAYRIRIGLNVADDPALLDEGIMAFAATALFFDSRSTRSSFNWYDERIFEDPITVVMIRDFIQKSIVRRRFTIRLQPIFEREGARRIVAAEALVRWNLPGVGMLSPNLFLPIIEKVRMLCDLDLLVLDEVCVFQEERLACDCRVVPIAINLAREDMLSSDDLVSCITAVVDAHGLDHSLIQFELLEGSILSNGGRGAQLAEISKKIGELRDNGFKILIDDFGSGVSNLRTLLLVPFDTLKLDKDLLDFCSDSGDSCIMRHLVQCAAEMGKQVIAEGVEDESRMEYLKGIGCHLVQGYLLSRPLHSKDFSKLIDRTSQVSSLQAESE